jgi:hypothetical protein
LLGTAKTTSSAGGNETDLGTLRGVTANSGRMSNMLMVSSSVRMLDGVHGNTSNVRPLVTLNAVLVVSTSGLQDGLLGSSSSGDDSDHTTAAGRNNLARSRGELDAGLSLLRQVRDDGGVVSRSLGELGTISQSLLNIANNGTLGHGSQRQHVSDGELSLLSAVQELSSEHTLGGNEQLLAQLEAVRITELNNGERSSTTGIVDNLLHDTLDVSLTLSEIESTQLGSSLSVLVVRLED